MQINNWFFKNHLHNEALKILQLGTQKIIIQYSFHLIYDQKQPKYFSSLNLDNLDYLWKFMEKECCKAKYWVFISPTILYLQKIDVNISKFSCFKTEKNKKNAGARGSKQGAIHKCQQYFLSFLRGRGSMIMENMMVPICKLGMNGMWVGGIKY